jgi:hypothetical protein
VTQGPEVTPTRLTIKHLHQALCWARRLVNHFRTLLAGMYHNLIVRVHVTSGIPWYV